MCVTIMFGQYFQLEHEPVSMSRLSYVQVHANIVSLIKKYLVIHITELGDIRLFFTYDKERLEVNIRVPVLRRYPDLAILFLKRK